MDRVSSRLAVHLLLLPSLLVLTGTGCSRLKGYRAQDSPLPGLSLLGRGDRNSRNLSRGVATVPTDRAGSVAWSGPTQIGDRPRKAIVPRNAPPRLVAANPSDTMPAPAGGSVETVRTLIATGRESLGKIQTYQVTMSRQERVGETLQDAETLMLSVRRSPKAVRLTWTQEPHKGREVLYSSTEHGGQIHINMADSVLPIPRMSLPPDSPMVMRNSRHPITEAGLDSILDKMEKSLGDQVAYEGNVTPPEVGSPCHKITRRTESGESWIIYLDGTTAIPRFVQASGPSGELLERYEFRDLVTDPPSLAEASAFDPDSRWGAPKGLLGRMAQGRNASTTPR